MKNITLTPQPREWEELCEDLRKFADSDCQNLESICYECGGNRICENDDGVSKWIECLDCEESGKEGRPCNLHECLMGMISQLKESVKEEIAAAELRGAEKEVVMIDPDREDHLLGYIRCYKCPKCQNTTQIMIQHQYCPQCGVNIKWIRACDVRPLPPKETR